MRLGCVNARLAANEDSLVGGRRAGSESRSHLEVAGPLAPGLTGGFLAEVPKPHPI